MPRKPRSNLLGHSIAGTEKDAPILLIEEKTDKKYVKMEYPSKTKGWVNQQVSMLDFS